MFKSYYDMFNNSFAPHPQLFDWIENQPIFSSDIKENRDIPQQVEEPPKQEESIQEQNIEQPQENSNLPVLNDVQYHVETTERKKPFWRK